MGECAYKKECRKFLKSLDLKDSYFDRRYDMCYCGSCHAKRGDRDYYTRGEPAKTYALPLGWCRFALRVSIPNSTFQKCHRAYHGTKKEAVREILSYGKLAIPGTLVNGKKVDFCPGHFTPKHKPSTWSDDDCYRIYVSPSIQYSGDDAYAKPIQWTPEKDAKVAFQVLINGYYTTNRETLGLTERLDKEFANEELEWSTANPDDVHIYGLLVRLYKHGEKNNRLNVFAT